MKKMLFKLLVTFVISLLSYKVITFAENKSDVTKVYKFKQQGWKVVEKQNIIEKRPGIKPYQNLERVVELVKYKLKKGEVFNKDNIRSIRPGLGLKPKFFDEILGKKASMDLERGEPLSWEKIIT